MRAHLALALVAALGCTTAPGSVADAGDIDAGFEEAPHFLTELTTADALTAMTSTAGGSVRYLAPVADRPALPPLTEPCYFQNMRRYSWHLAFLRSFPELAGISYDGYLGLVLHRSSRRLWGGAIEPRPAAEHPRRHAPGVVSYSIYGDPGSVDVAAIVAVDQRMKSCASFARDQLVFVPQDPAQRALVTRDGASLVSQGVDWLFPENL